MYPNTENKYAYFRLLHISVRLGLMKLGVNYHNAQAGFRDYIDYRCGTQDVSDPEYPDELKELSLSVNSNHSGHIR